MNGMPKQVDRPVPIDDDLDSIIGSCLTAFAAIVGLLQGVSVSLALVGLPVEAVGPDDRTGQVAVQVATVLSVMYFGMLRSRPHQWDHGVLVFVGFFVAAIVGAVLVFFLGLALGLCIGFAVLVTIQMASCSGWKHNPQRRD